MFRAIQPHGDVAQPLQVLAASVYYYSKHLAQRALVGALARVSHTVGSGIVSALYHYAYQSYHAVEP